MHRIDSSTKSVDKFGAGKHGFTEGDPSAAVPPTQTTDDWLDALQEELCNVIEAAGITLVKGTRTQLRDAVQVKDMLLFQNFVERLPAGGSSQTMRDLAYRATGGTSPYPSQIVMVGNAGTIQTSVLGLIWTAETPAGGYSGAFQSVAYDGTYFVAVGSSEEIETATDPTGTWTQRTPDTFTGAFQVVRWDGTYWVLAGSAGEIQTATNPTGAWTTRAPGSGYSGQFQDAHFANGIWVLVGAAGEIQTATDPTGTWTKRAPGGSYTGTFYGVTYSEALSKWVIVGAAGEIQTATDPTGTWTVETQPLGATAVFFSVLARDGFLLAVGAAAQGMLVSQDGGTTWIAIPAIGVAGDSLQSIFNLPFGVIGCGVNGQIVQSISNAF